LSTENTHDIACLCDEWEAELLRKGITEWISANEFDMFMQISLCNLKYDRSTTEIEEKAKFKRVLEAVFSQLIGLKFSQEIDHLVKNK
jgi:hypothetical protein